MKRTCDAPTVKGVVVADGVTSRFYIHLMRLLRARSFNIRSMDGQFFFARRAYFAGDSGCFGQGPGGFEEAGGVADVEPAAGPAHTEKSALLTESVHGIGHLNLTTVAGRCRFE